MPATFSRLKIWVAEVLDYSALNAEFDNILNNFSPGGIGGYSTNLAQMQTQTDPFPVGNPSLPNSLAGEIERIRFQLQAILGTNTNYWYEDPPVSLSQLNDTVLEGGLPNSRLDDGPVSGDEMIRALRPDTGANGTAKLDLTTSSLTYYIGGQKYTQLTTVTVTGFSGAPTTNNTALINSAAYIGQQSTQYSGEHGTFIPVDTVGSEITAVAGKVLGFKVVNGGNTEYFIGQYYVDPTLGAGIYKARRGMFFDYQFVAVKRISLSDNNVITLCRLAWLYIGTNGVVTASYNTPTWSQIAPASPDLGDYWFSLTDTVWRTYSPSGWALSGSVLIGQVILDGNNVVGARTTDRFRTYADINEILIEVTPTNTAELQQTTYGQRLSVYGNPLRYGFRNPTWTAANLSPAGSLANNTTYYAYVEDDGNNWLSTIAPHDRRGNLAGYYHPSFAWRCVGYVTTNGSAQFIPGTVYSLSSTRETYLIPVSSIASVTATTYAAAATDQTIFANATAASQTITLSGISAGQTVQIIKVDSTANTVSVVAAGGTKVMTLQYQSLTYKYDGTTFYLVSFNTAGEVIDTGAAGVAGTTSNTWGDIVTLIVPAGKWLMSAAISSERNGGTMTSLSGGIGDASGTSSAGLDSQGHRWMKMSPTNVDQYAVTVPNIPFTLVSATTYYLKYNVIWTVSAPSVRGSMTATRLAF